MAELDLAAIIDKQASGIAKAMRMPETKTTSVKQEQAKKQKIQTFRTRIFVIIDDYSGQEYADFINTLILDSTTYEVLREVENWTKDGELIRVVDYIESS